MQAFPSSFQRDLADLMRWRRDVRVEALLQQCLDAFLMAPSVGLSEPWRVIRVQNDAARQAALKNFKAANAEALSGYGGDKAKLYANLKLSGMQDAPVQLAVFCDDATGKGAGLGAGTMPDTRRYSVVSAINLFWLAARARGIGVGWVSILDPDQLRRDLEVPDSWTLVGYLCVGWPEANDDTPELERAGWEDRRGHLPIEER